MENNIKTRFSPNQFLWLVSPMSSASGRNIGYSLKAVRVSKVYLENEGNGFEEHYSVWHDQYLLAVQNKTDKLFSTLPEAFAYIKEQEDKR